MVEHGKVKSNFFIVDNKLAYISDVSKIYTKDIKYFKKLKCLIIDCLWYNPHPSHFNLETALGVIKKFNPKYDTNAFIVALDDKNNWSLFMFTKHNKEIKRNNLKYL